MITKTIPGEPTPQIQAKAAPNQVAIQLENLTKTYGHNRGINNLNLSVPVGEVFGFLGPNGAGKTTTIRILLNLIAPTGGRALINGLDAQRNSVEIKKEIGYLPGEFSLYGDLTGAKTARYFANLRGEVPWRNITTLAERLDLDLSKKFRQYSRGNKQKIAIIIAFMTNPKILVLDEPTAGLDPLNQQEFYQIVREARARGTTIFFSSHIMSEVEKICDRVGIIREGELVKVDNISTLTALKVHHLEFTFAGEAPFEEFKILEGVEHLERIEDSNSTEETLRCVARPEALDLIVKSAARYSLTNFVSREPTLEEVFLNFYRETPLAE